MHFIVKLFPEITIKSAPVRRRFTKQLRDNLRHLLRPLDPGIRVQRDWEKIEISTERADNDLCGQVEDVLSHTPGIANFARVEVHPLGDMEDILAKTMAVWGEALAHKTFSVRVKRNGRHEFSSIDVERYIGGGLREQTRAAGVKLKNPDIVVRLEIRDDRLYVVRRQRPGLGGFPLGTQEPVLSLVSGGFDSTVASYLMMKRGIRTHFCFFNIGGRAHEVGVKEVAFYLWRKFGASHRVKFVTIPFEGVVGEILQQVDNAQMGVVLKRMMLRAASRMAREMGVGALVTGEAIAQVSSQTLPNLSVIDSVTDTLVLRPLIATDKNDIITIARQIGTEEFAANMPEYCGVISARPTTRARRDRIEQEESRFDFAVLEAALAQRNIKTIDQVVDDLSRGVDIEVVTDLAARSRGDTVVIDIRHPDEEELKPLRIDGAAVEKVPFYRLNTVFPDLSTRREYLLYCDRGVMSQLHAAHLREEGFDNVGVYRPGAGN
ncbi:tRNA 4-thiouridine(8) synthase ThiI [Exilibacterium tricleocarpae]|uniref:tRNA sulfurtransferase n=1 Tax=Exilibacterium tricleocarpae TaxID=2591008 RepID=A0A545ST94_9GAMM|nr:tRNA uracil 4-sulfurtransferase ThiI [Exilibacterium tricleocarpae]TQV68176.1 tRNA 4-thiouridine(8) synthase ThiI [Exilibacterium tricleocarpae]